MAARRKSYQDKTFSAMRSQSEVDSPTRIDYDRMLALGKFASGCVENSIYVSFRMDRANRLIIRAYDENEQYEESLALGDDWDLAFEQMLEFLRGQQVVADVRKRAVPKSAERASDASKTRKPMSDTRNDAETP